MLPSFPLLLLALAAPGLLFAQEPSWETTRLEADGPPTGVVENVGHPLLLWEADYCPE